MADRAVLRSAEQGAFDSLRGVGKPLPRQARYDEQFFTVDATQQAINRYGAFEGLHDRASEQVELHLVGS
jgi:hypothetical protein